MDYPDAFLFFHKTPGNTTQNWKRSPATNCCEVYVEGFDFKVIQMSLSMKTQEPPLWIRSEMPPAPCLGSDSNQVRGLQSEV